jgi:hypothetical protein
MGRDHRELGCMAWSQRTRLYGCMSVITTKQCIEHRCSVFRPVVVGSDQSGWEHVVGQSASATVLLFLRSPELSQASSFIKWGCLFLCFIGQLYDVFYASKNDWLVLKIDLDTLLGYFLFCITRVSYVLGTSGTFTLKMDSDVRVSDLRDGFVGPN